MKNKRTIRQNVEGILRDFPLSRNDDKMLICTYWNRVDGIEENDGLVNMADILLKGTSAESITRARRLIQEEGKYLPNDTVVAIRRGKEVGMIKAVRQREVV